ncbi:MAG: PKD domain-containing protein, partial [Elusimicrobiota bacterium]
GAAGTAYGPPCGGGNRLYTYTLYALSGALSLSSDPAQVTGSVLTTALSGLIISSAAITLTYTQAAVSSAPVAAFSFSPASPTTGQTVTFTDTSTYTPSAWAWNFGDGSTSTLQSPTHVFSSSGSYTVSLTAANTAGSNTISHTVTVAAAGAFALTSPVGLEGAAMAAEYTCDGAYASPALAWSGAPAGTQQFALLMTTLPGDGSTKWNWVLYGIPAAAYGLDKNTSGVGTPGVNSDTQSQEYAAPCSQGPGPKVYTYTLYALSGAPSLPAAGLVTGDVLTSAISSLIISSTALNLTYARANVSPAFSFYPSSPTTYNTVSFTDASQNAPVSWAWDFGDNTSTSTAQYPTHVYSSAGSYTVTLNVANSISSATLTRSITVTVPAYNISQGISDQAQGTTLAFDALGLMNANLGSQSYFPPGKVADYTGFQFLRDSDSSNMGHNPDFTGLTSNSVIRILTDSQLAQLAALAVSQADQVNEYAYHRFRLMQAFRRLMDGNIPSGATGLSLSAVTAVSQELYLMDGQIAFDRALAYANVYNSMTRAQLAELDAMKGVGASSWTVTDANYMKTRVETALGANASNTTMNTLVMTYAGDLFSWYSGNVEADVYFCPERQGTYYGGFYIKDAPAMNAPQGVSYTIDSALTGNAGAALLDSSLGYVASTQAAIMTNLIEVQRSNMEGIVAVRAQIAALLRTLLVSTASSAAVRAQVLALSSATYGTLDGINNYYYATTFKQVADSLSTAQRAHLKTDFWDGLLISTYSNGTPYDYSVCRSTYLYSDTTTDPAVLARITPYIDDTDYLFATDAPSAAFSFSPASPAAGETVAFTDASGGSPTSWEWDFGDGGSSAAQNPAHAYASSGTYTVTLTAANTAGSNSVSHNVSASQGTFTLTSGAGTSGGAMALEYSCSGAGSSPAMSWTNAPSGTQQFALTISELTPQLETKYNWVLYGLPAAGSGFAKNTTGGGTVGKSDGAAGTAYGPPCGGGNRLYTYRLYALSGAPSLPSDPAQVTGAVLTTALTGITISSAAMTLTYTAP